MSGIFYLSVFMMLYGFSITQAETTVTESSITVQTSPQLEVEKVEYLLKQIEDSKVQFIRNDKTYTAIEAAQHLRKKLDVAQNSIFAPKREKWTAVMFIEKVASKSSISGEPYIIQLPDGQKIKSQEWLTQQLKNFKK